MVIVPATVPIITGTLEAVPNTPWLAPAGIVKVAVVGGPLANFASNGCVPPPVAAKVSVIVPVMLSG